ncbi:WXG100 family type VII secretion target [Phytomonospora endophytica]|uniref:Uncharacterized protein YukE n=1 Tax=Phytomonospora endophytica TaxID=714109 RepID=A0A841FRZ1_9ACTN|nr:hypothetical protein [Phytomonospora endophytica]MBB6034730.1 uncharacterized protein YukE [Phytomonospora endophytica]GIG69066.1 hypothetical protein Pen01_53610 [Phytomonospora endophytica]
MPEPDLNLIEEAEQPGDFDGTIIEDIGDIVDSLNSGDYADAAKSGVETFGDLKDAAQNPGDFIVEQGLGWAIEHFKPLTDAINKTTGDPAAVEAYAKIWANVAEAAEGRRDALDAVVTADLGTWQSKAARKYRTQAGAASEAFTAVAQAAKAMEGETAVAAKVVEEVRTLLTDKLIEAIMQVKQEIAAMAAMMLIPVANVIRTTAGVARVVAIIQRFAALFAKIMANAAKVLARIQGLLARLGELMRKLQKLLDILKGLTPQPV